MASGVLIDSADLAVPTAMLANKCPTDKSNCTVGPKVPFYWLQAE